MLRICDGPTPELLISVKSMWIFLLKSSYWEGKSRMPRTSIYPAVGELWEGVLAGWFLLKLHGQGKWCFSSTVTYYHEMWRFHMYSTTISPKEREKMLQNSDFNKLDRLWQGTTKSTGLVCWWLAGASKLYIMIIVNCPHKKWNGRCVGRVKYVNHV